MGIVERPATSIMDICHPPKHEISDQSNDRSCLTKNRSRISNPDICHSSKKHARSGCIGSENPSKKQRNTYKKATPQYFEVPNTFPGWAARFSKEKKSAQWGQSYREEDYHDTASVEGFKDRVPNALPGGLRDFSDEELATQYGDLIQEDEHDAQLEEDAGQPVCNTQPAWPSCFSKKKLASHCKNLTQQDKVQHDPKFEKGFSQPAPNTLPTSLPCPWEQTSIAQLQNSVQEEVVQHGTKFEEGFNWIDQIGPDAIHSLKLMQAYYRAKDFFGNEQTKSAKERSKKMLDKDWEHVRASMVKSFKNALLCRQCQDHHLKDESEGAVKSWEAVLEKIDPDTVDREILPEIKNVACWFRNQYLKKVHGTRCQGFRTISQGQNVEENRERADSGVEMDLDVQEMELDFMRMEM